MSRWTTGDEELDQLYAEQLETGVTFDFVFQDGTSHGHIIDPETAFEVKVCLKEEVDELPEDGSED